MEFGVKKQRCVSPSNPHMKAQLYWRFARVQHYSPARTHADLPQPPQIHSAFVAPPPNKGPRGRSSICVQRDKFPTLIYGKHFSPVAWNKENILFPTTQTITPTRTYQLAQFLGFNGKPPRKQPAAELAQTSRLIAPGVPAEDHVPVTYERTNRGILLEVFINCLPAMFLFWFLKQSGSQMANMLGTKKKFSFTGAKKVRTASAFPG